MPELPRGTVTFLFTDIEGSTRLWQAHPTAMRDAIARHDEILRTEIEGYDGVVFKTVGDAVCAAFASAPQAVRAALSAQRALADQAWGETDPLRVRMALHSGEADAREGDYVGQPLNRVARVLAAGHGGQILLSAAAHELVRDALPPGMILRDLGEHQLKDLYRPERVFQLLHPALPADFPPLKSLDRQPHNLPLQPTPLVGRERDVADVTALLLREEVRLVTLTGPGGTGKTRLALQAAADLLDAFPDGAWFVDLAPVTDPALVPGAIAAVLGVQEEGGQPLREALAAFLRTKRLLLLLDNLEQVVAAAPIIAELVATEPGLTVLATSRVPLRLRGEYEVAVPPLALPDLRRHEPMEQLTQYAAVRLFIQRATAAKATFAVTNANAPAVAAICHRLDGLPLALELAAARIKQLPPEALLTRLERRLPVLTGGMRDAPARQRTMRDAIAWSYDLLPPAEQTLFRRLGVFVGGFTLEAAEAVAATPGDLELDVFDGVGSLLDASLLRQETDLGEEPRYRMLEMVREFALAHLDTAGEAAMAGDAHAAYVVVLAERVNQGQEGPEQARWLDIADLEHGNFRAALAHVLAANDTATGLRLVAALWQFWIMRGHVGAGRQWAERVLALRQVDPPSPLRAQVLVGLGFLALWQDDLESAKAAGEEGLAIQRVGGDAMGVAEALHLLGNVASTQGDLDCGRAVLEEALELRPQLDERRLASLLCDLGLNAVLQGDLDRAEALYEESLALSRQHSDPWSIATELSNLAEVARKRGDLERAAQLTREAVVLYREVGDEARIAGYLEGTAGETADPMQAARLLGAAARLREATRVPVEAYNRQEVDRVTDVVRIALDEGEFAAAMAAGRSLSLDEAIAEALTVTDNRSRSRHAPTDASEF